MIHDDYTGDAIDRDEDIAPEWLPDWMPEGRAFHYPPGEWRIPSGPTVGQIDGDFVLVWPDGGTHTFDLDYIKALVEARHPEIPARAALIQNHRAARRAAAHQAYIEFTNTTKEILTMSTTNITPHVYGDILRRRIELAEGNLAEVAGTIEFYTEPDAQHRWAFDAERHDWKDADEQKRYVDKMNRRRKQGFYGSVTFDLDPQDPARGAEFTRPGARKAIFVTLDRLDPQFLKGEREGAALIWDPSGTYQQTVYNRDRAGYVTSIDVKECASDFDGDWVGIAQWFATFSDLDEMLKMVRQAVRTVNEPARLQAELDRMEDSYRNATDETPVDDPF